MFAAAVDFAPYFEPCHHLLIPLASAEIDPEWEMLASDVEGAESLVAQAVGVLTWALGPACCSGSSSAVAVAVVEHEPAVRLGFVALVLELVLEH